MKHFWHAAKAALIVVLGSAPAVLASKPVRDFVANHPAWAVYVPVAAGVLAALAKALRPKPARPAVTATTTAPVDKAG